MSQAELIRVRVDGAEKTISFSQDHFNHTTTANAIAWQLNELFDEIDTATDGCDSRPTFNLDFDDIDGLSSAALNQLIGINSKARSCGVRLVLTNVNDSVRDVFELTRLERMFELMSPLATAQRAEDD